MLIIQHRCNESSLLAGLSNDFGCEIDIRNHGDELIVIHDAFNTNAEFFSDWLSKYAHKFLIVNVKEEGLEEKILPILKINKVEDFFILDESFPYIRKWALSGESRFAVRVSQFESYRTALSFSLSLKAKEKKVSWVWIDCFDGQPIPKSEALALKSAGFKLCYVSPELHHIQNPACWQGLVKIFFGSLSSQEIIPDAVCTKIPSTWLDLASRTAGFLSSAS